MSYECNVNIMLILKPHASMHEVMQCCQQGEFPFPDVKSSIVRIFSAA